MRETMLLNNMKMVVGMKALKVMEWGMGKENSFINRAVSMMVNGRIITCTDMENYSIQIIS